MCVTLFDIYGDIILQIIENSDSHFPDHIFRGTSPAFVSPAYRNTPEYCYTYEGSKRFCLENQGSLVTIEDPVKYKQTLEFARSFIRASKKLQRAKFWTDMQFCNSTCDNVSMFYHSAALIIT